MPRTNGIVNVNAPNVSAPRRLAANSSRSSSSPARNMRKRIPRSPSDSTMPVALDPAEDERTDEQPAEDDADDPREAETLEEERADEDDREGDEERPLGGRRRELERERHAVSLQLAPDGGSATRGRACRASSYLAARSENTSGGELADVPGRPLRRSQISEFRVPAQPGELDGARRAVAVLREDDLGDRPAGRTPRRGSTRRDR